VLLINGWCTKLCWSFFEKRNSFILRAVGVPPRAGVVEGHRTAAVLVVLRWPQLQ